MSAREQVAAAAIAAIMAAPTGIRWTELYQAVRTELPTIKANTVTGALRHFQTNLPPGISKPERGLYIATAAAVATGEPEPAKKGA